MSSYASAAFYSRLTSSRVTGLPLTAWLNENGAVALYALIAPSMQVVVWISKSFLVDFIAIATCRFVIGPVYPITVSLVTKATPYVYHPGALSLMACLGQSGSALFPLAAGPFADIYGIKVLQPVLVTLFIVMILLWQLVPSPRVGLRGSSLRSKPASIEERLDPAILGSSI